MSIIFGLIRFGFLLLITIGPVCSQSREPEIRALAAGGDVKALDRIYLEDRAQVEKVLQEVKAEKPNGSPPFETAQLVLALHGDYVAFLEIIDEETSDKLPSVMSASRKLKRIGGTAVVRFYKNSLTDATGPPNDYDLIASQRYIHAMAELSTLVSDPPAN